MQIKTFSECQCHFSLFWLFKQSWAVATGGGGGRISLPPPFLSDQITLSQPGGANYAHIMITCPSDLQTFLQPCKVFKNNSKFASGHDCDYFVPINEVPTGHWPLSFNCLQVWQKVKNCGVSSNLVAII